jgi:hypothetical protein
LVFELRVHAGRKAGQETPGLQFILRCSNQLHKDDVLILLSLQEQALHFIQVVINLLES